MDKHKFSRVVKGDGSSALHDESFGLLPDDETLKKCSFYLQLVIIQASSFLAFIFML